MKQKVALFKKNHNKTGNVSNEVLLDEYEVRLSQLFGKHGSGLAVVQEIGVKSIDSPSKLITFDWKCYNMIIAKLYFQIQLIYSTN